jgi:putative hydrolase of HD superfamily
MPKLHIDDVLYFFGPIHKVKSKERAGWKEQGVQPAETIGAHTFGAAHLAWLLSKAEGADADRVVKMTLVWGLRRASLPDLTPQTLAYFKKPELEHGAFEELAKHLPSAVRDEFKRLFDEYNEGKTLEAKLAREADKLDTILQAISYERETGKRFATQFFATYSDQFETGAGKALFDQLRQRARRGFRLKRVYDVRVEEAERAAGGRA